MSEFDFDELDKAVAGALVDTDTASEPALVDQPRRSIMSEPAGAALPAAAATTPPALRRTSGRFMDVVHPSSDMRPRPTFTAPSATPASVSTPTQAEPIVPSVAEHDTANDAASTAAGSEEKEAIEWDLPLDSPFLPDTKVEKRPLGGAAPATTSHVASQIEALLLDEPEPEHLLEAVAESDSIDFAAHASALPSESEDTGVLPKGATTQAPVIQTPVDSTTLKPEATESLEAPIIVVEPTVVAEPTGPTSITQQYTVQPGAEQVSGAMYDTQTYHQPIQPAPKKHHGGIGIVIWIFLLVVLGAGAGVAFYLYILPML